MQEITLSEGQVDQLAGELESEIIAAAVNLSRGQALDLVQAVIDHLEILSGALVEDIRRARAL